MSITTSLHHVVINTYCRRMVINTQHQDDLYRYIWQLITERKCKLLRIGGIENHIHLLIDLHPSICLAGLIGEIKRKSNIWMKQSGMFPLFEGWGKEYFAISKSAADRDIIIQYIKNQRQHHTCIPFEQELRQVITDAGFNWDERFLSNTFRPLRGHIFSFIHSPPIAPLMVGLTIKSSPSATPVIRIDSCAI